MKDSISKILKARGIVDKYLLHDLETLYVTCMAASRALGRRASNISEVPKEKEANIWNQIYYASIDCQNSEQSIFAEHNLNSIKKKYGFYIKNNGDNLQSPRIHREASSSGYSLQALPNDRETKFQQGNLSIAPINKLSFREGVVRSIDSRHPY